MAGAPKCASAQRSANGSPSASPVTESTRYRIDRHCHNKAAVSAAVGETSSLWGTVSEPDANLVRLFVTNAPAGSQLRSQLDRTASNPSVTPPKRFEVTPTEGWQVSGSQQLRLALEAGGVYTFVALEIERGDIGYGGAYEGDPAGFPTEEVLAENEVHR